jgi:hypothetical protein
MKLKQILKHVLSEVTDKTILTSNPNAEDMEKFVETTKRLMKLMKNSKIMERSILYNRDHTDNLFTPSTVSRGDITQHLGEFEGSNFGDFTRKIAEMYEKVGFKVEMGYGSDDIKGFEIKGSDGEVVGEVDFLEKNSIPKVGDTIIIKYKK